MKLLQPESIDAAIDALANDQLVVVPTRRWYMICANAASPDACGRIFSGKSRPTSKSLVYVLPSVEAGSDLFSLSADAQQLALQLWPGDLAMILPWRDLSVGNKHSAVGAPNALVTCAPGILGHLAKSSRVPIAATTVNVSGDGGPTDPGPAITVAEVRQFIELTGIEVAYCVDGGICPAANHLTIVDCATSDTKLVRTGVIHDRAIQAALSGTR